MLTTSGYSQILDGMKGGLDSPVVATNVSEGRLITVSLIDDEKLSEIYQVAIYNGSYWNYLPNFQFNSPVVSLGDPRFEITSVCEFQGDIYIGGRFNDGSVISFTSNLYRFDTDTRTWESPANNIKTKDEGINQMIVLDNKLIAAGKFTQAGTSMVSNIAQFDGTDWSFLGTSSSVEGANGEINALEVSNDYLYIGGQFNTVGGNITGSIARWKPGIGWGGVGSPFSAQNTESLMSWKNQLVAVGETVTGDSVVRIFNGGQWFLPSLSVPSSPSLPRPLVMNNQLFIYGPFNQNGNNFDLAILNQSKWEATGVVLPSNIKFRNFKNGAIAFGNFRLTQNNVNLNNVIYLRSDKILVGGTIFGDTDNNCIKSTNEFTVPASVSIKSTNFSNEYILLETNDNGEWQTELNLNTPYQIKVHYGKDRFNSNCSEIIIPAQSTARYLNTLNMGLNFSEPKIDLSIQIANLLGNTFASNEENVIYLEVRNNGSTIIRNKSVHLDFNSTLSTKEISPLPADQKAGELTWAINNLKPGERTLIKIVFEPSNSENGEAVTFFTRTGSGLNSSDEDLTDNNDTISTTAGDIEQRTYKTVSDEGAYEALNTLDYGIYFQNPTNRVIKTVTLIDTLDTDLPLEEIRITGISHKTIRTLVGNVYTVRYENVNLQSKEMGNSQNSGFFTYKFLMSGVKQKANDQEFTNTATLIYEYQEEQRTNTVKTVLSRFNSNEDVSQSNGIHIYPNPVKNNLSIENNLNTPVQGNIYNLQGKLIQEVQVGVKGKLTLDIHEWTSGIYILHTSTGSSTFVVQ